MAFEDLFNTALEEKKLIEDEDEVRRQLEDRSALLSALDTEKKGESILDTPLTVENTKTVFRGLLSTADEALIREGDKSGIRIFMDTMSLMPRGVAAIVKGTAHRVGEVIEEPSKGIPAAASLALGIAGGATGIPALAIAGAYAGRTAGQYILSKVQERDFGTMGDFLDIATGGISSVVSIPAGGVVRGALRRAGAVTGSGTGLVKNIVERSPVLDPKQRIAQKVAFLLSESAQNAQQLRDAKYASTKTLKLITKYGDRNWKDVLLDPKVPTRDKTRLVEEVKSLEEDRKMVLSLRARKGHETRKGTVPPELQKQLLTPEEKEKPLNEILAERVALRDALLAKPSKRALTQETAPGTKRRFVEYAETQEKERIRSGTWRKQLNEYANDSLESMRLIVGLTPEVIKNPLLQKLTGRFSNFLVPALYDTQVGFRKNNNRLLQHTGDILLHASETVRTVSYNMFENAKKLMAKHNLGREHMLHLSVLQNKGAVVQAWDETKKELMRKHALATQRGAPPTDIDSELREQMLIAAKRYGYSVGEDDIDDMIKSLTFLDDWRSEVMDPLFGVAHTFNRDPKWLPLMNPTYFLPTSTHRRDLVELKFQKDYINEKIATLDLTTEIGRIEDKRYREVLASVDRKEKIATKAAATYDTSITNIHKQIEERGVRYTLKHMGSMLPSKQRQLAISWDLEGSTKAYIDGFTRKVVYDNALPAAYAAIDKFVKVNGKARPYATTRAAAWAHNVLLDQLGSRKNAKLENIRRAFDNPLWHDTSHRVGQFVNFISQSHYVLNVAMKPRFYGLQLMQNFLALAPQVDT